jgi:hypothetical protein
MHIALLHLLASQTTQPPGTLTIGEGVALAFASALVGISVAYGVMRAQLNGLTERIDHLEKAAPATALVRLEERLASVGERIDALRRELRAGGHLPHRDGE